MSFGEERMARRNRGYLLDAEDLAQADDGLCLALLEAGLVALLNAIEQVAAKDVEDGVAVQR